MNILLWVAQVLLAAIMVTAGAPKLFLPRARLVEKMSWTKDTPVVLVRLLGLAELLGAVGLILPRLTGIAPILTPLAAGGLSAILLGALATKLRHHESPVLPAAAMLLAAFIAVGRMHTGAPHGDGAGHGSIRALSVGSSPPAARTRSALFMENQVNKAAMSPVHPV
jgi:DoxX-like family